MRADRFLPPLVPYVEPLSDARTPLGDFFSILLGDMKSEGNRGRIVDGRWWMIGMGKDAKSQW
jgi:hypothetical protein